MFSLISCNHEDFPSHHLFRATSAETVSSPAVYDFDRDGRLEILDGGPQPKIRIGSTCGGGQPELAGTGRFEVDLDLPAIA
ncbi:hypothetical protein DWB58_29210, partial [candidate division KSB1 bacterium]|nr:hypothetical protein [candidate division KSB1 bacterium]